MEEKNPSLIFEDANLNKALKVSKASSFENSGQVCLATSKILVQQKVYDKFLKGFLESMEAIKVGDPLDEDTYMGPVVSQQRMESILKDLKEAKSLGAKVYGGQLLKPKSFKNKAFEKGYFLTPATVVGLDLKASLFNKEIFGPVTMINAFKSEDEGVKLANDTDYGLGACVWTENLEKAYRVASRLEAGTVWINSWRVRDPEMPFGGFKKSGLGREGGEDSLRFFTEEKNVCLRL